MTVKNLLHEDWQYFALVEEWNAKRKKWYNVCFKYFPFAEKAEAEAWCKKFKNEHNSQQRVTLDLVYVG